MKTFAFAIVAIVACVSCTALDIDTQHVRKTSEASKIEEQKAASAASAAPVSTPVASTPTSPPEQITKVFEDIDGDGFAGVNDCDESNKGVHKYAPEQCNNVDDDCDGETDEGQVTILYLDEDKDGYGGPKDSIKLCEGSTVPKGYVKKGGDCNDSSLDENADGKVDGFGINSAATETCDGIDNNCDGTVDDPLCVLVGMSTKLPIIILNLPVQPTPTKTDNTDKGFGLVIQFPTEATRTMSAQEFYFEGEIGKWWNIEGWQVKKQTSVSVPVSSVDVCGVRFNVATGDPATKWLCEGNGETAKVDPTAKVYKVTNNVWEEITAQVKPWSAPGGASAGCSALVQFKVCK